MQIEIEMKVIKIIVAEITNTESEYLIEHC